MKKNSRFDSLDVLRILTTFIIVIYHAHLRSNVPFQNTFLSGWFNLGYLGVDIFFVLSGLLFERLYGDSNFSSHTLWQFFKKRISRIYPTYAFFSLIFLPVFFLAPMTEFGCENRTLIALLSFLMIPQNCSPVLSIAWTLPIQLYCYFLFGLLRSQSRLFKLTAGSVFCLAVVNYIRILIFSIPVPSLPHGVSFFITPYILEFAVGVLLAHTPKIPWSSLWFVMFFTLGLIFNVRHADVERVLILGTFSTFVVHTFDHWRWQAPTWMQPTLKYLSTASYFVFLTHFQFQSMLVVTIQALSLAWNNYFILVLCSFISPWMGMITLAFYSKIWQKFYFRTTTPAPTTLPL